MKRTSLRKPPAMDLDLSFLSQRLASQEEEANEPTLNLGAETPALYSPSYSPTYSSGSGSSPSPPLLSSSDGYDDYGYEGHHKNKSVLHEYLREELQRAFLESPSVLAGAEGSGDFSSSRTTSITSSSHHPSTYPSISDASFSSSSSTRKMSMSSSSSSQPQLQPQSQPQPSLPPPPATTIISPSPRRANTARRPSLLLDTDYLNRERESGERRVFGDEVLAMKEELMKETGMGMSMDNSGNSSSPSTAESESTSELRTPADGVDLLFSPKASVSVSISSSKRQGTDTDTLRLRKANTSVVDNANSISFPISSTATITSPSISSSSSTLRPFPSSSPCLNHSSSPSSPSSPYLNHSPYPSRPSTPLLPPHTSPGYADVELNSKIVKGLGSLCRIVGFVVVLYVLFGSGAGGMGGRGPRSASDRPVRFRG